MKGKSPSAAQKRIIGDDKGRLMSSVEIDSNGCWLWRKYRHRLGYGVMKLHNRLEQAHRAAWLILVGAIPSGMQLNHRCHVRHCVNPQHLYLGTQTDNMRDMEVSGRAKRSVGSKNGSSKLTEEQALEIRARATEANGRKGHVKALCAEFGISESLVRQIRRGEAWRHV
jgi:hypothetical protein